MENTKIKKDGWKDFRDWLQVFIILFATLIGAYEFIYKDLYKPSVRPTSLNVDAKIELAGEKNGTTMVKATINAENPSDRRIYVPAFWLTVRGFSFEDKDDGLARQNQELLEKNVELTETNKILKEALFSVTAKMDEDDLEIIKSQFRDRYNSSMHDPSIASDTSSLELANQLSGAMVYKAKLVNDVLSWWEPMDKTTNEFVFTVPSNGYDYLEMTVSYFHTRYIEQISPPQWSLNDDGSDRVNFSLAKNPSDTTAFVAWQKETASGYNWNVTTLPLWH